MSAILSTCAPQCKNSLSWPTLILHSVKGIKGLTF